MLVYQLGYFYFIYYLDHKISKMILFYTKNRFFFSIDGLWDVCPYYISVQEVQTRNYSDLGDSKAGSAFDGGALTDIRWWCPDRKFWDAKHKIAKYPEDPIESEILAYFTGIITKSFIDGC